MRNTKDRQRQIISRFLFLLYMLLLIYFLFFSEKYGRTTVTEEYHYNLKLFKEIRRFWDYRQQLGFFAVATNLAGNIICFMPFGFMLPELDKTFNHGIFVVFCGFVVTLCVETMQLVFRVGSFDVDDILLNTIGTILGYLAGAMYRYLRSRK